MASDSKDKGLIAAYKDSADTRMTVKKLLALSFVPVKDVQFAFEILSEDVPEYMKSLYAYWEDNYIGRRLQNIEPRFPIPLWNMFDRINSNLPKSNNSLEAWHKAFQNSIDCHHPSFSKLLEHLKLEQSRIENFVTRYRAGFRLGEASNSSHWSRHNRLKIITKDYTFRQVLEYLEAVAYNLSL